MASKKTQPASRAAGAQRVCKLVDTRGYTSLGDIARRCNVSREYVRIVLQQHRPGLYARAMKARQRPRAAPVIAS